MERIQYLSGSFDGLSSNTGHHYFKSSFAKSMAFETAKSLNFELDTVGDCDHQMTEKCSPSSNHRCSDSDGSFEFIKNEYRNLQRLYDDLSAKYDKLKRKEEVNDQQNQEEAPCIELTLAKSQVETLQWQLKQVESSNQMYKAVLEQVSKFLEKAHTSLNTIVPDRPNLPIKNRRFSLKSSREEHTEKLSLEAYRLYRTVQSIIQTKEPDLVQHLQPCYSSLFDKNSNLSTCSCDSLPTVCNNMKCLEISSDSSNHSESFTKNSDFCKKDIIIQKSSIAVEDESGFSSISSHDNNSSPTYPELGLPPRRIPVDKFTRRWSSVSSTPISQSFNYHTTGGSNTSTPIKVCWV
ncbi:uncharacterized protein LOC126904633 [Daktulosphaira vitifoliae]|uniref:uncharacterized protein LOC126904633 n=1 Tax=Daktulosphaira vitifoliae TaxID=58002 RepID=UPI0021AA9789|nr:uncharacterized protein LOC126904633 [Daktulosphaira vitifoliae]